MLTNQVAFATCRFQCLLAPSPITFHMVNSPLCCLIFPRGWCLLRNKIHPLNPILSGPDVDKSVVQLNCAMLPQDLLFQGLDGVLGSAVRHEVGLQPSSSAFQHWQHVILALAALQECDVIHVTNLPIFTF